MGLLLLLLLLLLFIHITLADIYYLCEPHYACLLLSLFSFPFWPYRLLSILLPIKSLVDEEIQASIPQFFKSMFLSDPCRAFMTPGLMCVLAMYALNYCVLCIMFSRTFSA